MSFGGTDASGRAREDLLEFLKSKLANRMPNVDFFPCHGRIYKEDKLRRTVEGLPRNGRVPSDAVIALTDVYRDERLR
jgi:hypothetical protein